MNLDQQSTADTVAELELNQVKFNKLILSDMFSLPIPDFHKMIYQPLGDDSITLLVVLMPRGFAKTTILQGYLTQQVLRGEHRTIAYVADTQPQAERHTEHVRHELEHNDKIQQLWGPQRSKKWGSTMWTTLPGVTVMPFGSSQSMRGLKVGKDRPSLIIMDDMENDENVGTEELREKLWYRIFAVIKPMIRRQGKQKIVYLGTAVHEDCVLLRLINLLQSDVYKNKPYVKVVQQGARDESGQSIWPSLMSTKDLLEEEEVFAAAGQLDTFYQEYICEVIASRDASFPKDRAVYYKETDIPTDTMTWMSVDMAWSTTRAADYSSVVVFSTSISAGAIYVREAIRMKCKPNVFLKLLEDLNKTFRPLRVYLQKVTLDEFFQFYSVEKGTMLPFESVKISHKKDAKLRRVASLEPLYVAGRLRFLHRHADILAELWMHPKSKRDDLKDSLAMGVSQVRIPGISGEQKKLIEPNTLEWIRMRRKMRQSKNLPGLTFLPLGMRSNNAPTNWKYN